MLLSLFSEIPVQHIITIAQTGERKRNNFSEREKEREREDLFRERLQKEHGPRNLSNPIRTCAAETESQNIEEHNITQFQSFHFCLSHCIAITVLQHTVCRYCYFLSLPWLCKQFLILNLGSYHQLQGRRVDAFKAVGKCQYDSFEILDAFSGYACFWV